MVLPRLLTNTARFLFTRVCAVVRAGPPTRQESRPPRVPACPAGGQNGAGGL